MGIGRKSAAAANVAPAYQRVPNINLLRPRSAKKQLTSIGRYSLLLALLSGLGLVFMLYQQTAASGEKMLLSAQLSGMRSQIDSAKAQKGEAVRLQTEIERLELGTKDYQKLASFNGWSGFLAEVQQKSSSAGVALTAMKQKAGGIVVSGWSPSPKEALAFHESVAQAAGVAQCALSSLSKSPGEARFSFTLDVSFKGQGGR
ncbi:MAG: hypothetical protein HYY32_03630 [Chloroflexi bacterium]|nr:hypothetical protein [Chloroflexota bacterium]